MANDNKTKGSGIIDRAKQWVSDAIGKVAEAIVPSPEPVLVPVRVDRGRRVRRESHG